jgi:hypothetical protein
MERRQETNAVKGALRKAGIGVTRVAHGRGTAWGWMSVHITPTDTPHHVYIDAPDRNSTTVEALRIVTRAERDAHNSTSRYRMSCVSNCPGCEASRKQATDAYRVVGEVTGRTGEYNGRVNIHQG